MNAAEIRRRLKDYIPDTEYEVKKTIVETISRLPGDVIDWALPRIFWFCPAECNGMAAPIKCGKQAIEDFRDDSLQGESWWVIRMIYIAPQTFATSRDKQMWVMAHELAHHWLGHDDPSEASEDEADKQARAWGFRDPDKDSK